MGQQAAPGRDIIILVIGATGAGKSYFINKLLEETSNEEVAIVGCELASCTVNLLPVRIKNLTWKVKALKDDDEVIIVDTPGFDDTMASDFEILKRIADWFKKSCQDGARLGGVIYLHDISQDRFSGTARKNLEMFNHLCGDAVLHKVVLVTSKWGRQGGRDFWAREKELQDRHWRSMLNGPEKMRTMRFDDKKEGESAVLIVVSVLRQAARSTLLTDVLRIQNELVNRKKFPQQTQAAKALRAQLEDMIQAQTEMWKIEAKAAEGDEDAKAQVSREDRRMERLANDVMALQLTMSQRIKSFFRF
ncbi:P-loop containing nucleoside triphosphate hydrolase protein [Ephemerocybe angulata]|uniref:P-loop containing nucleoside triphosphate hydrolase protein n=1 Tax=Ephemerocybe angulata TaxID=980116 RepID=A0A8H6HPI3_9AGAR|nr:P-loop containing nucleoside triphosphate hydrolase protein [Tulosesus angulatus]